VSEYGVSEYGEAQRPGRFPAAANPASSRAATAATDVRRGVINLARRLRQERQEASLTALELSALGHLHRRGPLTPGDLASAERVQPQSLTRTLAALEASSLLARQPDPADGRRSLLAITESGEAALRVEMEQRDAWLATTMAEQLTATEIELLRLAGSLLERLADAPNP
jgi:DNA-binding MarR family transcriptional regulator